MAAALRKRLVGLGSYLVRGQRPWRGLQPLEPARLQQTRCFSRSSRSDAIVGETEFARGMVLPITTSLDPINPDEQDRIPVYRMVQEDGTLCEGLSQEPDEMLGLDRDQVLSMYQHMLRVMAMDKVFYDAQRQGRISFYMQNAGEEGVQIGTAAGLEADDPIHAQYREAGVLMWRGYTLQDFADQCFSNEDDPGKGRQMPVHYGSKDLNFFTISSPLTTQVPQAAGVGYALKQEGKGRVSVVYFGEGAASEGDFHAGMNIACTLECPVLFVCRNNGYAISTPTEDQYRGDGIAPRGVAYGMRTIRVDGNDTFAVLHATKEARRYASEESKPVLIETMAYREGHHSTSDDSTAYREPEEIARFRAKMNPVFRMRQFLERRGWWDDEKEKAASKLERRAVLKALTTAEGKPKPGMEHLFTDVYAGEMPWHLKEQKEQLEEHVAKYPEHYQGGH